jgi:hypothetical protein
MRKAWIWMLALGCWASASASTAHARAFDTWEENYAEPVIIESPMWFALELKLGPYQPNYPAFKDTFGSDRGWLLATELDFTAYRIPYVGLLSVGLGWGWVNYDAKAAALPSGTSGEDTEMTFYPMNLLGVLRIDALARHTAVPLTVAGKIGSDFVRWKAKTGGANDGDGVNIGLRWGVQAALELDFIDERATRRLDEDFGINHTYFLFEFFDSNTEGTGDQSFLFGVGLQL